jgi:hypothetical protein
MKWVTRQNIGVDRMACCWLIKNYIDETPELIFLPEGGLLPEDGEPFDLPGVRLSHRDGHASFRTILKEYDIHDPLLERIAQIVDEADTVQEVFLEPVAQGLDFICRGVRLISKDDEEALERGFMIFTAIYEQLKASQ